MVWVLGSAPPPRPLPGPCCSLSLCLKPLKCRHVPPGHSGGNPDPQQVAIPTPSSSPRGRERTPGARWCGRAAQGPVLPLEELRVTTAVTPREKAPQAPGRSPTSAKNSSMKAVLSTAISTSSASSSCVSCSCETQRGRRKARASRTDTPIPQQPPKLRRGAPSITVVHTWPSGSLRGPTFQEGPTSPASLENEAQPPRGRRLSEYLWTVLGRGLLETRPYETARGQASC
eukprot:XP_022272375.1 uncharacterized protein LOC111095098 isoform X3 [Canis lupus familiaris]